MKSNNNWFLIIFVLIAGFMFVTISIVILTIVTKDTNINTDLNDNFTFENTLYTNLSNIIKYNQTNNTWDSGDYFSCTNWVIINDWKQEPICTNEFIPWQDNIDDKCDNNDYTPNFYTWGINIDDYMSPESILYDNDADARINIIWFLYPEETKTVFQINKDITDLIQSNKNNTYFLNPLDTSSPKMNMDLSNVWSWWVDINIITLDKAEYDKYQKSMVKTQTNWNISSAIPSWLIDEFWQIWWLNQYLFNIKENDYAINLKNNSSNIVWYKISMSENWKGVYIVPIKDDDNKYTYIQTSLINDSWNIKYFKKVIEKKKN